MKNHTKGFSLIEVLVSASLLAIISFFTTNLILNQLRQIKFLEQKLEINDLLNTVTKSFTDARVCTANIKDKLINIASTTTTTPSPTTLALPQLQIGFGATAKVIATAGMPLSASNSGVVVDKISFTSIYSTGNPNEYIGSFQISFLSMANTVALKPISFNQTFFIDPTSPPGNAAITRCHGLNSSAYMITLAQLKKYQSCSSCTFDCTTIIGGSDYFRANTACFRFCTQACLPGSDCIGLNAGPLYPTGAFLSGLVTECNGPDSLAACICTR